jgi:hypothetical protein
MIESEENSFGLRVSLKLIQFLYSSAEKYLAPVIMNLVCACKVAAVKMKKRIIEHR